MDSAPLLIRRGPLLINLANYRVLVGGEPVLLTFREYAVLVYLATRAGHIVSKRRLLEEGLGRHDVVGLHMVDVHLRQLKSKLERHGRHFLEEVDGTAYRFIPQEEMAS